MGRFSSQDSLNSKEGRWIIFVFLQTQRAALFIVPTKVPELKVLGFTLRNTERDSWSATLSATHQVNTTVEGSRLSSDNVMLRKVRAKLYGLLQFRMMFFFLA